MSEINPATAAVAAPAVAEPKKRGRKPKVVAPAAAVPVTEAEEAALLVPVDMPAEAPVNAVVPAAADADPFRNHPSRLQTIDPTRCVARTHGDVVVGTRPTDAGANGKFYHEKQCARKPVPGSELCIACIEKEKVYNTSKDGRWYGRLNQPMMEKSYVVGCEWFCKKYPNGIPADPTTRPPHIAAEPVAEPVAEAPVAEAPAPKKKGGRPKKAAQPAAVPANEVVATDVPQKRGRGRPPKNAAPVPAPPAPAPVAAPVQEAVLDETAAPVTPKWLYFVFDRECLARNPLNNNVYRVDISKSDPIEQIMMNSYAGRWNTETGKLDRYAPENVDSDADE